MSASINLDGHPPSPGLKSLSLCATRLRSLLIASSLRFSSARSVPAGHAACKYGIHKSRSRLRSVMCAQKPSMRPATTWSEFDGSCARLRASSTARRFTKLTSRSFPALLFRRMGRVTSQSKLKMRYVAHKGTTKHEVPFVKFEGLLDITIASYKVSRESRRRQPTLDPLSASLILALFLAETCRTVGFLPCVRHAKSPINTNLGPVT